MISYNRVQTKVPEKVVGKLNFLYTYKMYVYENQ